MSGYMIQCPLSHGSFLSQMTYGQPEDAGTVDKIVKVSKAAGTKV